MAEKQLTDEEQYVLNRQLGEAAVQNNIRQIEKCINAGAQIDALCIPKPIYDSSRKEWLAPLHAAVRLGNLQAVKVLLENGADVDLYSTEDADTWRIFHDGGPQLTPLYWAAGSNSKNDKEINDLLLAAGADVYLKSAGSYTAGEIAIREHKGDYLESIEKDPNKRPTPKSVGLDIKKRNAALASMGKPVEENTEEISKKPETQPAATLTAEEIIRRQRQQAIENDEGI